MRNETLEELRTLSEEELRNRLSELRREYFDLQAKLAAGAPPEQVHKFKLVRRQIARVLTVMRERGFMA